jgi:hypothetical protein
LAGTDGGKHRAMTTSLHPIAFDRPHRLASLPFGIDPSRSAVSVTEDRLIAVFGRWRVETDLDNVASVAITGDYSFLKTAGPPHLSLRDRGLTFAGSGADGVCVQFHRPVRGIDPLGLIRHPGLTVTVEDPDALVDELVDRGVHRSDVLVGDEETAAEDALHTAPTSTLRKLAARRGVSRPSARSHAELVDALEPELDPDLAEELDQT